MADAKTYLNVPYAEKDAAKALGARWDAAVKKWYVPANKDVALFAKWQMESEIGQLPGGEAKSSKADSVVGGTTRSSDKNFVAYDGDEPPWD
ncbi:hypothetical protein U737_02240 [Methylomonas sp. LW13]|uniref:DUF5710 domain-containing protein n=1 Tax=unclassified Methylomonas TaxID=2608980 RepID=UPI00051BA9BC|nr:MULTISPECIES: DUF5710 domain-containing protein [unclassified Methylomonas]PKD42328.1 hypothetical protein CWO84_00560 [Methylomonas sp. Kb3]QBC25830.1 hypothetical protein U737_02240 [Methylomonas sp. LW13]